MKSIAGVLGLVVVLAVAVPFAGPWLGLAPYQSLAEPPGRLVSVPGGRLNVRQEGRGPDAILVHGHPGSAQMMAPLGAALVARGYRVTRYDRSGWGHSDARPATQPANPTAHAEDLLALTAALELSDPIFVGYSYGGGVVMEAARLAPDAVADVVLIASVGPGRQRGEPTLSGRILSAPLFLRWAFNVETLMRLGARSAMARLFAPETASQADVDRLFASLALPGVPTAWQREDRERFVEFREYRPDAVRGCVLIVHGDGDRAVSPEVGRRLARTIPGARLEMLAQVGHGLVLTQAERLGELIDAHRSTCEAQPALTVNSRPPSKGRVTLE